MSASSATTIITTTTKLSSFTGTVISSDETWALCHLTTYTTSGDEAIPTDHGCLIQDGKSYRIIVTDGLGHWDPPAIGAVAAEVLEEVSQLSIPEQIREARKVFDKKAPDKNAYLSYLKSLTKKYKNREGTTLLQAEVARTSPKKITLTLGKCGDSDLVVIDEHGKVLFATIDTTHHKTASGAEVGMLAIGGNFSEKWLDNATYIKTKLKAKETFVIAASDGLTTLLRESDGSIDVKRFQYAVLTGKALDKGDAIPSLPSVKLTVEIIINHLRAVAIAFAKHMEELKKAPAGDDTTIIALAL